MNNVIPFQGVRRVVSPEIVENGSRYHDTLRIFPLQGNNKFIKLKRTRYTIVSNEEFNFEVDGDHIHLPSSTKELNLELTLCSNSSEHNDKSRYLLRSLNQSPFRINGTYSYEAFIERGDRVDIGSNRFNFEAQSNQFGFDSNSEILGNRRLMRSSLSVLLEGDTGTGKTRLASKIHKCSERLGDFIHINLSSFSESLIESELFGHVKGSFTGAISDKSGAFVDAHGGTLFLDEIDSLSLALQTKLLLFLDSKEVRPVGGSKSKSVNVRIIFASGRNLKQLVSSGDMRSDFYYRISSGVCTRLPSLSGNPTRIRELCLEVSSELEVYIPRSLTHFYENLKWPGNVRQLMGHIRKKAILSKSGKLLFDKLDEELIQAELLDSNITSNKEFISLDELKRKYAYSVYQKLDQNISSAANALHITGNTLRAMIRKCEVGSVC
jgi:transcriptional regulator of acetoin/glycerol metabolism